MTSIKSDDQVGRLRLPSVTTVAQHVINRKRFSATLSNHNASWKYKVKENSVVVQASCPGERCPYTTIEEDGSGPTNVKIRPSYLLLKRRNP
jgi:hypothetical protein